MAANRKLSTRQNNEIIDAFNLFDADKDERINANEIISLIAALGGDPDCPHVVELVAACNTNSRGSLGREEFLVQWNIFKQKVAEEDETEEEIKEAFRIYDQDNDGYITKEEMVTALTRMGFIRDCEEEAAKCMAEMDLDKDGRVSFAEFVVRWRIS